MINRKSKQLVLVGEVNEDMYKTLVRSTDYIRSNGKVPTIVLNTPGGDFYQALAIYDWIRLELPEARILCNGPVMSAGLHILQSGMERIATENSQFLLHCGENSFDSISAKKHAEAMLEIDIAILTERSNLTRRKIMALLDRESFFDAEQALEYGLIDAIIGID